MAVDTRTRLEVQTRSCWIEFHEPQGALNLGSLSERTLNFESSLRNLVQFWTATSLRGGVQSVRTVAELENWALQSSNQAQAEVDRLRIDRISYNSPLEILFSTSALTVGPLVAALWTLPNIIRRFSRLTVDMRRDSLDRTILREVKSAYKASLPGLATPTYPAQDKTLSEASMRHMNRTDRVMELDAEFLSLYVRRVVFEDADRLNDSASTTQPAPLQIGEKL